ncbi:hypothetical protein OESDEN_04241 [Oesophagostomum dentatum]|uniref:Protein root UVB sensitive/RUS domain-containing protein n=1 Tax=Oesophagostomum dentatum TaxID=61180 RepID=A0A0B1TJ14_OESDE|nr:hypothetical protein OESDEN_04241 [Oesophagostomum dentatum]
MSEEFIENYAGKPIRKVSACSLVTSASSSTVDGSRKGFSPALLYTSSLKALLINIFLPQGYPYSVSEDYLAYQMWDTLQAFASSLSSALATEAVLKGAGVGDQVKIRVCIASERRTHCVAASVVTSCCPVCF